MLSKFWMVQCSVHRSRNRMVYTWHMQCYKAVLPPYRVMKIITENHSCVWVSLGAQTVKNLPAMQDTWVQSLGQEDFLAKGMATHSNILAWRIPRTEDLGGLQSMGSQRVGHHWVTFTFFHYCLKQNCMLLYFIPQSRHCHPHFIVKETDS